MAKPSLPQGTRDFGPEVVRKRTFILNTIRNVFELYGFQPLETPAMENLDTLMGKYGEEGDKLIFKILNNGDLTVDILKKTDPKEFIEEHRESITHFAEHDADVIEKAKQLPFSTDSNQKVEEFKEFARWMLKKYIKDVYLTKRALKYDLTIPFARYVAMNHSKLTFPFKRYQIQPVWRADRPQRGRYREFYQCDADVVGSNSLLNEIELLSIYIEVFKKLKINASIKTNNRKILQGLADYCGYPNKLLEITNALDKIDKIGRDGVIRELANKGIESEKITLIFECLDISVENYNKNLCDSCNNDFRENSSISEKQLVCLKQKFSNVDSEKGIEGINELLAIIIHTDDLDLKVEFDLSLARGLNYYTGSIFEAKAPPEVKMGSIGGGGRYDDLTGLFGVPDIPGVGISFGVDRIYDVMEELNLFPVDVHIGTQVLFFNLGDAESKTAFSLVQQLRQKGIRTELYHESSKFDKQFKYAEKKNIPYVIIIGEKELKENTCNIKNLASGQQEIISTQNLLSYSF